MTDGQLFIIAFAAVLTVAIVCVTILGCKGKL